MMRYRFPSLAKSKSCSSTPMDGGKLSELTLHSGAVAVVVVVGGGGGQW